MREAITACLIVRDEEERLPAALASVAWCDEIVVVDSGSADRTREIARAAGAKVVEQEWLGFGAQRNVALDHAAHDWVLEVDADERVSGALAAEIEAFLAAPDPAIKLCMLPLRHRFLGAWLGAAGKYPAYRARMFRRSAYRHDEARLVHEGLTPRERTAVMHGDIEHELAASWGEALRDAWAYARLESGHVDPLPPHGYVKQIVVRPAAKVAWRLALEGAYRDGWRGVVKVLLDAGSDAVLWARRAVGRVPPALAPGHFGRLVLRSAEVRLCAVVAGDPARALAWLRAAHAAGADVALVTDREVDGRWWLHVRRVRRIDPVHVLRALDAMEQVRPVDRLVGSPRWLGAVRRLAGEGRAGVLPPARLDEDPVAVVRALEAAAR